MGRDYSSDAIIGGVMQKVKLKPRWYYWWSPKMWKKAKLATQLAHYQGAKMEAKALKKLLGTWKASPATPEKPLIKKDKK